MNNNRLLTYSETYSSQDAIFKYFAKCFGIDSPEFILSKNNIVQISNPDTGEIFDKFFCLLHNENTFSSLTKKNCCLLVNEDIKSGNVIIYAINSEEYSLDIYEEAFKKALLLIDKMRCL